MNNKEKLILVASLLLVFLIVMICIGVTKCSKKSSEPTQVEHSYASNETFTTKSSEPSDSNTEPVIETQKGKMNDAVYSGFEQMNNIQRADSDGFIQQVEHYARINGKEVMKAEIYSATKEVVLVNVSYTDNTSEDLAVLFFEYSFERCSSYEYYQMIMNDENAGDWD